MRLKVLNINANFVVKLIGSNGSQKREVETLCYNKKGWSENLIYLKKFYKTVGEVFKVENKMVKIKNRPFIFS